MEGFQLRRDARALTEITGKVSEWPVPTPAPDGSIYIAVMRGNVEISNTQKVLDGDLDPFIEASLKQGV